MSINHSPDVVAEKKRFWRANMLLTLSLLVAWFTVGPLLGILLVRPMNQFQLGGFPLGFWFAQQGATVGFILIILTYAILMGVLDRGHRRRMEHLSSSNSVRGEA
jgi:putative solute:sodium symporter small subunit